ncbi:MAG: arginyltransferase [Spirochaetia bacterium]
MTQELQINLHQVNNGPCPYLPDRHWITHAFRVRTIEPLIYEELLKNGWRRSGSSFYLNQCPGCSLCIPLRVPTEKFVPTKSQRRTERKNTDISITVVPAGFREDVFSLYKKYNAARHDPEREITKTNFMNFLGMSPMDTKMMLYWNKDLLVGTGWVDVMPGGMSSVYYAFDPDYSSRSLGVYSVLREIELCRAMGKGYYYLGFWVPGSGKMAYKANYGPHEILIQGRWRDAEQYRLNPEI